MSTSLLCTDDQWDGLHRAADGHAAKVKVDRQALLNLLIDHARFLKMR